MGWLQYWTLDHEVELSLVVLVAERTGTVGMMLCRLEIISAKKEV